MSLPFDPSLVALAAVAWALTYAVHSTILLCGAWLLERRYSDKPELMSPIWKAAVLGGALSATLQMSLAVDPAFGRWSVAAEERAAATPQRFADAAGFVAAELSIAPVIAEVAQTDVALAFAPVSPPDVWQPALASALVVDEPTTAVAAVESTTAARVALALFALWIIGGLAAVIGLVRSWLALRRVLHTRVALRGGGLAEAFARLRAHAGGPRSVGLSVSAAIRVPLATGVVHPEIVVPRRALAELAPSAQESMLAHELGHVVRRDPAWRLALAFVQRVLFFQPLIGVATRRITQHAEYLADAWAARHTAEPLALARCLTEIAAWIRTSPPTPEPLALASGMAEPASILGRRVLRLVEPPPVAPRRHGLVLALACMVVPALAWIAPGASWAHDELVQPVVIANGEVLDEDDLAALAGLDEDDDVRVVVIDGGRAQGEMDALQHREPSRAAAARSDDGTRKGRRQNRKVERTEAKQKDAARREAEREIKQAFRTAKKRGELPDPGRIAGIVARAHDDAGENDGPARIVVRNDDGEHVVVERDEHGFVVRKDGKVVVKGRGHGKGHGKGHGQGHGGGHGNGIDLKVLDENGNVLHIRIPTQDIERIQRDAQRDVARAMRELQGARVHVERERARAESERDRVREQMQHYREFRRHAPRAPQPPPPPRGYGDIVPISPMPAPAPPPPPPPEAFYVPVPFEAPEMGEMPVPHLAPLAPLPPSPPAPPSSSRRRVPRAPKAPPRPRPDITTVALPPSA